VNALARFRSGHRTSLMYHASCIVELRSCRDHLVGVHA
jgi:hypothetical protein